MCMDCEVARRKREDPAEEMGREMANAGWMGVETSEREAMRMRDAKSAHVHRSALAEKWLVTWLDSRDGRERWVYKTSEEEALDRAKLLNITMASCVQVSRVVYETREVTKRELVKVEGEVKP